MSDTDPVAVSRPSLNWELADGTRCEMTFGFYEHEPTAAVFVGDNEPVMIPKDIMRIAISEGWAEIPPLVSGEAPDDYEIWT